MKNKKFRNDLILILSFLVLAGGIFSVFKINQKSGNVVKIIIDKQVKDCYNFNEDAEVEIKNGDNLNVLVIKDGEAFIKSANCPDKICVHHRKISKVGETIVCLPHKVVIEITEE